MTEILDLKYLYLEIDSKVYYNSNFTPSSQHLGVKIQANAEKYANSTELNRYGARFKYSKFLKILDDSDVAVTSNITTVSMRRDLRVALNQFAEYSIGFGNEFHIKRMDGFNIKSSAFKIQGLEEDLYIGDLPNINRQTGSLFFFTVPTVNSQTPTVVRRNVGKIDYINGIITLNPINIVSGMKMDGQTIIQISASPASNDVIGLQDLYLQLDISNSVFDMIVDDISSGVDSSASTYITSSSYPNGALVRLGGRSRITPLEQAIATSTTPTQLSPTANTGGTGSAVVADTTPTTPAPVTQTSPSPSPSPSPSSGGGGGGGYGGY